MDILSLNPQDHSNRTIYQHLTAAIAPRPIAWASTIDKDGRPNLAPFSFFNVFSSNPPILVFSPVLSGRDGSSKNTLDNVLEHPEVVINIGNFSLAQQLSDTSITFEKGVSEFEKVGIDSIPSVKVKPARVKDAPVSLECKVTEVLALGKDGGAGNLVVCEVVMVHLKKAILDEDGQIDPFKLDAIARMGGSWYCRVIEESLFEIPKPS